MMGGIKYGIASCAKARDTKGKTAMNIGEASKETGISVKMIRYYEETGLIRPALRTYSGYRVYAQKEVETLRFVRRSRDLGFTVKQIEALLGLWQDRDRASSDVKQMAMEHVDALERKKAELEEMIGTLRHLAAHCHGDARPDCPILSALGTENTFEVAASPAKARNKPGFARTV
jgi:Cu(I)-responsive transcriptional regulator